MKKPSVTAILGVSIGMAGHIMAGFNPENFLSKASACVEAAIENARIAVENAEIAGSLAAAAKAGGDFLEKTAGPTAAEFADWASKGVDSQPFLSAARDGLEGGLEAVRMAVQNADIPGSLAAAVEAGAGFVEKTAGPAAEDFKDWASQNPGSAAFVGVAAAGLVVVAAPGLVTAPLLGATGFGSGGVVGGSLAAGAQSMMGNVVAPGIFATLQSAGAGGCGLAVVNGIAQAGGLGSSVVAGIKCLQNSVVETAEAENDLRTPGEKGDSEQEVLDK